MKRRLTEIGNARTIPLVGETDAGSAEVQPARDSQTKATNCRGGGSYTPAAPGVRRSADNSEPSYAFKNLLPKASLRVNRETHLSNSR